MVGRGVEDGRSAGLVEWVVSEQAGFGRGQRRGHIGPDRGRRVADVPDAHIVDLALEVAPGEPPSAPIAQCGRADRQGSLRGRARRAGQARRCGRSTTACHHRLPAKCTHCPTSPAGIGACAIAVLPFHEPTW